MVAVRNVCIAQWMTSAGGPPLCAVVIRWMNAGSVTSAKHSLCTTMSKPLAHAGLSYAWRQLGGFGTQESKEVEAPARAAAQKALELDDRLAEAHVALGALKVVYDMDWKGGENSFIRAIEMDPNSLDAHFIYARLLMMLGRFPEAIGEIQRAEQLAPTSATVQQLFGSILYRAARPDEAIAHLKSAIELEPRKPMTYQILGEVYEHLDRYADAISTHEKARDVRTRTFAGKPGFNSAIARVYARTGRKSDARRILKTLKDPTSLPYEAGASVAGAYAALDDKNEHFGCCSTWPSAKPTLCMSSRRGDDEPAGKVTLTST